jgi:hypothetical protein
MPTRTTQTLSVSGVSVSQRVRVGVLTNRCSYLILYTDLPAPPGLATHWRDGFDYCTGFD